MADLESLVNFFQPLPTIGTAGQPTAEQFAEIAAAGYTAVVNLAMPDSDNAIADEGSIVAAHGMTYVHIPVPFDNPGVAQLRQYFAVMDALKGDKVFVHCAVNARVSAFTHRYLTLRRGMESEAVTSPLLRKWLPRMDEPWRRIMSMELDDLSA